MDALRSRSVMVRETRQLSLVVSQTRAPWSAKPHAKPSAIRRNWCCLGCSLFAFLLSGCVHRVVTVQSDPPGALVYMNEEEIGRTPVSKEFLWYGNYDMVLRKD